MDDQLELMGALMSTTQEQQAAIAKAIQSFERQNEKLTKTSDELSKVIQAAIQNAVTVSVATAVQQSMDGSSKIAQAAIEAALNPLLKDVNVSVEKVAKERAQLNESRSYFGHVLLAICLATVIGVAAVYLTIWWNLAELERLQEEAATMKENIAKLDNLKGHIKLANCEGRPCVEVADTKKGYGDNHNFFVLKGVKLQK